MKRITTPLGLAALLAITGCASTNEIVSDSATRPPTSSVEVFKGGRMPERHFKEIAELSFLGPREDELKAQKFFMRRAKRMGGNGLIFTTDYAGQKGGLTAFHSTAWVFKARVLVYE